MRAKRKFAREERADRVKEDPNLQRASGKREETAGLNPGSFRELQQLPRGIVHCWPDV